MSQSTKTAVPFVFNPEQRQLAEALLASDASAGAVILKSRQIGTSTFFCFLDVVVALMNPGIKVAIVVDTQWKAADLLQRCKEFCRNLGLHLSTGNTRRITLPNRSEIHAITATGGAEGTESKVGRSQSYQLLHLSELPYWPNQTAYASLLATSSGAPVWIESTAKTTGDIYHKLWTGSNNYRRIFFSVQDHAEYVADPESISSEDWQAAQELGFTSKPHAAWWYRQLQQAGGNYIQHLHDYPIVPAHAFLAFDGRWIRKIPEIIRHHYVGAIKVFNTTTKHHRYLVGVDTSGGVGRDANAVVVLDRTTKQLVAYWKDSKADIAEVVRILQQINALYSPDVYIIETNGIGQATSQAAKAVGLPVQELTTTAATKYAALLATRQAIESGYVAGCEELVDECLSLRLDGKGRFVGEKDSLMALGMALTQIELAPHIIPKPPDRERVYMPEDFLPKPDANWY